MTVTTADATPPLKLVLSAPRRPSIMVAARMSLLDYVKTNEAGILEHCGGEELFTPTFWNASVWLAWFEARCGQAAQFDEAGVRTWSIGHLELLFLTLGAGNLTENLPPEIRDWASPIVDALDRRLNARRPGDIVPDAPSVPVFDQLFAAA